MQICANVMCNFQSNKIANRKRWETQWACAREKERNKNAICDKLIALEYRYGMTSNQYLIEKCEPSVVAVAVVVVVGQCACLARFKRFNSTFSLTHSWKSILIRAKRLFMTASLTNSVLFSLFTFSIELCALLPFFHGKMHNQFFCCTAIFFRGTQSFACAISSGVCVRANSRSHFFIYFSLARSLALQIQVFRDLT